MNKQIIIIISEKLRSSYDVLVIEAFCLNAAQGHMNGAPNKTQTHSWRFASP